MDERKSLSKKYNKKLKELQIELVKLQKWVIKEGKKMCDWRGKVNRSDDGNLVITNFDGSPVPHRVFISENYRVGYSKGIDYIIDFVV